MSDNSTNAVSVPQGPRTVKQALSMATSGLPIHERDFSAWLSADATSEEVVRILDGLWFAEQRVLVRVRFKVGDLWNQLNTGEYAKVRKSVLAALKSRLEKSIYQRALRRFHNYAWVCRKWPEDKRHDRKPWTFFVANEPGTGEKPQKPEDRIQLRITRRYAVDGREFFECAGRGEREYLAYESQVEDGEVDP